MGSVTQRESSRLAAQGGNALGPRLLGNKLGERGTTRDPGGRESPSIHETGKVTRIPGTNYRYWTSSNAEVSEIDLVRRAFGRRDLAGSEREGGSWGWLRRSGGTVSNYGCASICRLSGRIHARRLFSQTRSQLTDQRYLLHCEMSFLLHCIRWLQGNRPHQRQRHTAMMQSVIPM